MHCLPRHFRRHLTVAAIAALGLMAAAPHAAAQAVFATVEYVPADSNPPVPAGLKVTCVKSSDSGAAPSDTCPVVKYQGITTWAYSYLDNRVSLALVSYDSSNTVIANVEKPGARYVFEAASSVQTDTVLFVGQARQYVTATWAELGPK
jgi:hypothetical protein